MINLIPPHARKQVKIEYWVRVVSVWFFLLVAALLIVAVLHIPSYALIQSQISAYQETYDKAEQNDSSFKEIESVVSDTNAVARHLLQGIDMQSFSEIIDEIELLAGETISIKGIDTERLSEGEIETVIVRGEAATRNDLASYRDVLAGHEMFIDADLPISNLAKDKDVSFMITLTLETEA